MKRLTAVLLVVILMMTFLTGCGKDRALYSNVKLENYIELKDYLGIEIDTSSAEFVACYNSTLSLDVQENDLYKEVREGVVQNGDIINLDYEGKLDGVAFEGGTAKGAELEIGSKTFIDDFEEELIGVAVGATKDVTAKFPENYGKSELNGKEAVFTCKVNFIKKAMTEEEAYEKMKFNSVDEYKADIKDRAVEQYIHNTLVKNVKIKDYPKEDSELLLESIYEVYVDMYKSMYNVNIEDVLKSNGSSVEEYKAQISSEILPEMMKVNMIMYYILDAEKLTIDEEVVNSQTVGQPLIAESYAVQDIVMEYLRDKAKIK